MSAKKLVLENCAHIGLHVDHWLVEEGMTASIFNWPDPLTAGPISHRLDPRAAEARALFWNKPVQSAMGEEELLTHLHAAPFEAVIVWGVDGSMQFLSVSKREPHESYP